MDKVMHKSRRGIFCMLSLTVIFGVVLASSTASADNDSVVDEINITVPVSCTLSGTGMNTHNAEIGNGQYNSAIGETTLKAFCNDNEGFAIYAIGYTDDEEGKNVLTNSTLGSTYDIVTGTATSGNTSNWAMKLSTISSPAPTYPIIIAGTADDTLKESGDPDYSTFQEVPDDYTKVAYRTASTDTGTNAEGSTLKTTYQTYISPTQPAGTYTGQVKYTLVHPYDAAAPEIPPKTIATVMYLQDVETCPADLATGQVYTLKDSRDEQEYKVAKLADEKCWMLENLALDPTDSSTATNMSEQNTNASAAAITNYLNGGSSTTGWSNIAVANITSDFDNYVSGYTTPRINNQSKNTLVTSYGPASINGQAKVGIYYNFCAATVGTYCYEASGGVDVPNTLNDAPQDICPSNWRMPTGGDSGEYYAISSRYGSNAANENSLQYALSTPLSGYYSSSSVYYQNSDGSWWSSTYRNEYDMFRLRVYPTYINPSNGATRYGGYSVRCLLKV